MNFGKLVFGIFLVGMGALLLVGSLGYLPAGVWPFLARFWPILLLSFGLALLANAIRNVVLGVFAIALVLGAFVVGGYWISRHTEAPSPEDAVTIDLRKPPVRALMLRGRTVAGSLTIDADTLKGRALVSGRNILGKSVAGHWWETSGGTGEISWPARRGLSELTRLGGSLQIRLPPQMPLRLDTSSYFGWSTIDLTALRPDRCETRAVGSSLRFLVGAGRPARIHVAGTLSNVEIALPPGCPARVEYSRLTWHDLPDDFTEHLSGNVKGKAAYWTASGKGPPVQIVVDGPFMKLRVSREPIESDRTAARPPQASPGS